MQFWRSVFSETDGMGSFARVASAVTLVVVLSLASYVTLHQKSLPAGDLLMLSPFVVLFYGTNKAHDAVTTIFPNKDTKNG